MVKIYILIDPETLLVRYVGITTKTLYSRLSGHLRDKRGKSHKINWVQSLVEKKLNPIIEQIDEVDYLDWEFWESYWICQFKTWGFDLTNGTLGGIGNYSFSKETRQKLRESKLGDKNPAKKLEVRQKISIGNRRQKHSEESRGKISEALRKRIRNPDSSKKSAEKRQKIILQFTKENVFVKEWVSKAQASEELKISKSALVNCLTNLSKSAGGFIWKYKI
jgi:hypothetical protein